MEFYDTHRASTKEHQKKSACPSTVYMQVSNTACDPSTAMQLTSNGGRSSQYCSFSGSLTNSMMQEQQLGIPVNLPSACAVVGSQFTCNVALKDIGKEFRAGQTHFYTKACTSSSHQASSHTRSSEIIRKHRRY